MTLDTAPHIPQAPAGDRVLRYRDGVAAIFSLEIRQRLRARSWYIMLAIWFVVIGMVFALAALMTSSSAMDADNGAVLFDLVVGFVLLFGLLLAPGLSANAVNGDRAAGTLAILQITLLSPGQILWGKWLAAWMASLGFLVASAPFILWALALGGVSPVEAVVSLLMLGVELGLVCAVGIGVSAVASRPLFSIVTTYMLVALLGIGTLIAFGLSMTLVEEENVRVSHSYYMYPEEFREEDYLDEPPPEDAMECVTETYTQNVHHTERTTWLLAANPFVVVADSVPYGRYDDDAPGTGVYSSGYGSAYREPGVMEGISEAVRNAQAGPDYEITCEESLGGRELPRNRIPIWPLGLTIQSALAGVLLWAGYRRLVTPARRLPRGTRIA
jgi:ABC-2 type transport system permease protein